jgi:hypothetical protein
VIYPIANTSISFNQIKQDLTNFVLTKPDASRWADFYTGGEGTILIELIAGLGFYDAIKIIFSREEEYLFYANSLLSARACASNLTYSAYRGQNRRYTIKFTPTTSSIIPAFSVIGSQGAYSLITLKSIVLNSSVEIETEVVVGKLQTVELEAPASDLYVFRFNEDLVSEDYTLTLNGATVPTTARSADALNDKYLVQSNSVGGVNVMYFNLNKEFTHKYHTGDKLALTYVQYEDIPYLDKATTFYSASATITGTTLTQEPESISAIQVKAPMNYETQQLIRGRNDYQKNFSQLKSTFKTTNGRDISPAYVELTYVQENRELLNSTEEEIIMNELTYRRSFGIPMPYIAHPNYNKLAFSISLKSSNPVFLVEVQPKVDAILSKYEYAVATTVDFVVLEKELASIDSILTARISNTGEEFVSNSWYHLGEILKVPANTTEIYRVVGVYSTCASTEPAWNYTLGETTEDNKVTWLAVPKTGNPKSWVESAKVQQYDTMIPSNPTQTGIMFRAIRTSSLSSGSDEPSWNTELGSLTCDGEVIWQKVGSVITNSPWNPNTGYSKGDFINSVDGKHTFQAIEVRRFVGAVGPDLTDLPNEIYYAGLVLQKEDLSTEKITLGWNSYAEITSTVTVV